MALKDRGTSWLGYESWLCHLPADDLGQSIYLSVPQFPYLENADDNDSIYLLGLEGGVNEVIQITELWTVPMS